MKNNKKKNFFSKGVALLLATLFSIGGMIMLFGSTVVALASESDQENTTDVVTEDDFITVIVDGCVVRYPVVRGNNGALFCVPCVHSCLRCGKCTLEHPCNEINGAAVKCTCKEPLRPIIKSVEHKSGNSEVFAYDADENSFGVFLSNVRSVIEYRSVNRLFYVELSNSVKEEIISIKLDDNDIKLLDEKKVEFWCVDNTKRERIDQYILDKNGGYIQFAAKCSGSYLISSHMFNQVLVTEKALISKATCTEPAKYHYSCNCGAISEDESNYFTDGDPKGHNFTSSKVALEAKCSETGIQIRYCEDCDYTEQDELPAKGHSYADVVLTRLPSQTTNGELKFTCSVCGNIYRDQLPLITAETDTGNYVQDNSQSNIFVVFTIVFAALFVVQTVFAIILLSKKTFSAKRKSN